MKTLIKSLLLIVLSVCFIACNNNAKTAENSNDTTTNEASNEKTGQAFIEDEGGTPNALQLAIASKDHSTLVAAVQAAEVENALVNVGPLTVFAPNNAGFAKIDEATLNDLLKPENKSKLAFILTHHVAPANYPIETLKKNAVKNRKLYMASGKYLEVTEKDGDIYVDGVKIIGTVNVSNGWVHVTEDVILPKD
ncbi:fasciclin domain-containing protein [Algibacter luteus]|uniref:Uncaracterized surface protein containing fasciclin (FAS1) repeats n=1 Tax=Algibacter luteus TaxID=1178825 RepID=A0A1M6DTU4_9FLAO|nr:fasciclin domain-containing protein [Algibacter luteus]WJJ96825.1 fasciclin domain-containing protein [Algibacter luteus]SHI76448.1 Uncaracterized surface protein containing fasciclin (FAS1) repeats [Algibacter luteus]